MGGFGRRYRYDRWYREPIELTDGRRALLRTVRPSDKQMLLDGFEQLSRHSRYQRFMGAKVKLTEQELQYLTEVNGIDHFAIGAIRRRMMSKDEGIGIARFVRLNGSHDTAEPAVTVADDYQGKALGSVLLQRLTEAAWERDIRWFCVELLADNLTSKRLFAALSPEAKFRFSGAGGMVATLPVPEPAQTPTAPGSFAGTAVSKLFSYVAQASVQPPRTRPSAPPR